MWHMLKRHPFAVEAHFDFTLALTFAVPAEKLRPLLYPGLELDTYHRDTGFLAIAMVQTRDLRPEVLPAELGQDFFLTGYRIFCFWLENFPSRPSCGFFVTNRSHDS